MNTELTHKVDAYGTQRWYLNGVRDREDGPAVIYPDGAEFWYLNGVLHRTDGPAVIFPGGDQCWYLNDESYDFSDWLAALDADDKTKTLLTLKWSSRSSYAY